MSRLIQRELISVLGGAAAWPMAAWVQQGERMRRIAVLSALANVGDDQADCPDKHPPPQWRTGPFGCPQAQSRPADRNALLGK